MISTNMTIIINIQTMSKIINPKNNYTFDELENKTYEQLNIIQQDLIPQYNQVIKNK